MCTPHALDAASKVITLTIQGSQNSIPSMCWKQRCWVQLWLLHFLAVWQAPHAHLEQATVCETMFTLPASWALRTNWLPLLQTWRCGETRVN